MEWLAGSVIVLTCVYLLALAGFACLRPKLCGQFLSAFASSVRIHYLEMALRLLVGVSLVSFAPHMALSKIVSGLGWAIVLSTVGLLLLPWQWHQKFARRVIPGVLIYLGWFAFGSLVLAGFLIYTLVSA